MDFIISLLIMFCNDINVQVSSPAFIPACMSATKAASIQSGVAPAIDQFINKEQTYYQSRVIDFTGDRPWAVASGMYMIYKKNLAVSTSLRPLIDTVRIEASVDSQSINLSWSF